MVVPFPYHRKLIQRMISLFETLHGFGTVDSLYGVTFIFRSNSYSAECPNVLTRVNEPMEPVPPEIVSGGCQVGLVAPVVAVAIHCSKPCVAGAVDTGNLNVWKSWETRQQGRHGMATTMIWAKKFYNRGKGYHRRLCWKLWVVCVCCQWLTLKTFNAQRCRRRLMLDARRERR